MKATTTSLSASEILSISISSPEELFSVNDFDYQFTKLKMKWHPDRNKDPRGGAVFDHVNKLAEVAKMRISTKTWNGKNTISFTTSKKSYNLSYSKLINNEICKMYIGKTKIGFVFTEENKDLYENGLAMIRSIKYKNKKFEKQFKQFMPDVIFNSKTDIGYIVIMKKPKGVALLQDVIDIQESKVIPPKHTAWIIGAMYNLVVFLDSINIVHNAILPSTVFIDPIEHSVMLFGGWWYARLGNSKLKALPSILIDVLPNEVMVNKVAKNEYDRLALKATAISCLGDPSLNGSKLLMNPDIPKQMLHWLRSPSLGSAIKEYEEWYNVLKSCFGKRKFIKMDFDITQLY